MPIEASNYIYGAIPAETRDTIANAVSHAAHEAVDTAKEAAHVATHPDEWVPTVKRAFTPLIQFVEQHPDQLLM